MASAPSRTVSALRTFLASEAAGGIILIVSAALAIIVANSPWAEAYHHLLHAPVSPELTPKLGAMTVHLWINDALMAVFFFLVGLEIKRELLDGRLASWPQRRLPVIAAAAGMAVPAMIYLIFAGGNPMLANGWAIPAATDIAFAMGVLALLGKRAPTSLKLFLVTVAIVDDMGAVAIIALFYSGGLNVSALIVAGLVLACMLLMNRLGVRSRIAYIMAAAILWYVVLLSGVHATIAGVLAALTVPLIRTPGMPDSVISPLHQLEHALAKPVAFIIVPLFGFANAGVSLAGFGMSDLASPLPLGIAAGLFLGKQLGIFAAVWLTVKSGFAQAPRGATWLQIYGIALLCGIGFTMSLFIGGLAFPDVHLVDEAKIGTLVGSLVAAIAGFLVLRFAPLHRDHSREEEAQAREIAKDGDIA